MRILGEIRPIGDGDPVWTKAGSFTMGLDPLGLQATSIRIYQSLVPNVTNITNRLRYYAFFPWLIELYEKLHHNADPAKFATFVRRGEALYALATVVHDTEGSDGLGGANWAFQRREEAKANGLDLKPFTDDRTSSRTYLQATRGNFGAAYAPTLAEMGWLSDSLVPVTTGVGKEVAAAFAQSIGSVAEQIELVVVKGQATAQQLDEIGAAIHPAKIAPRSKEQQLLRDFLIGQSNPTREAKSRASTIWLILDLYSRGVNPGDLEALRKAFYLRVLPSGHPYNPSGETIDRWRAYQANEYGHIALECALNGLIGLQCDDYPYGIEPRDLIAKLIRQVLPGANQTWADWAIARAVEEDEIELGDRVRGELAIGGRPTNGTMLDSCKLLGILWAKWSGKDGNVRPIIATVAGTDTRSLDGILRTMDAAQNELVTDAIASVLFRHIVIDHQIIAGRKLSAAGTFTYHFLMEDGLLSEGRLGQYGYTTPRLANLTRVLRDAGYLDANGVTADGEAFLEQQKPL